MPKKPEIDHPLRKLRLIVGKSQAAFAKALGCSVSVIKKIEAGDNSKFNDQLVLGVFIVFAVSPPSILPPATEPVDILGRLYTNEFFKSWSETGVETMKNGPFKESMIRDFDLILSAALRSPGMSFGGVMISFNQWMVKVCKDFKLDPHLEAVIKERKEKARRQSKNVQVDWEMVQLYIQDKSKFLMAALEADFEKSGIAKSHDEMKKANLPEDFDAKLKAMSKVDKLKTMVGLTTKTAQRVSQELAATTSGPKRSR